MAGHTVLYDFRVQPNQVTDAIKREHLKSIVLNVIKEYLLNLKHVYDGNYEGSFYTVYHADRPKGSVVTVRTYPEGLLTINIDYYLKQNDKPFFSVMSVRKLELELMAATSSYRSHGHIPITRGDPFEKYMLSADFRLLEYDLDASLFEAQSPYQRVEICHSKSLGNVLILDKVPNLSEADLIYTETLMQRGKENYAGKEIVILGGGDGGLLNELLKENPKHVTMLEIDDVVMKACSKYLRSVCGDVLDKMKTDKYEIIVGDCFKTLDRYVQAGRKFDYVFGDLTDFPIDTASEKDEGWNLIKQVLNSAMKLLKPTGKYLTHANGITASDSLKLYENILTQLGTPVKFTKDYAWVPAFYDKWVFYQVSLKN